MKPEEFDQAILAILQDSAPTPKYPLWTKTSFPHGQIVGYHYASVAYCFDGEGRQHHAHPGWYYHILVLNSDHNLFKGGSCRIESFHESDIDL